MRGESGTVKELKWELHFSPVTAGIPGAMTLWGCQGGGVGKDLPPHIQIQTFKGWCCGQTSLLHGFEFWSNANCSTPGRCFHNRPLFVQVIASLVLLHRYSRERSWRRALDNDGRSERRVRLLRLGAQRVSS